MTAPSATFIPSRIYTLHLNRELGVQYLYFIKDHEINANFQNSHSLCASLISWNSVVLDSDVHILRNFCWMSKNVFLLCL